MAEYRQKHQRQPLPPLDPVGLEQLAVSYLERFQTSRARLVRHLRQKLRQRGWAEGLPPPDPEAVAARMEELGYVNDDIFAESRARGLARRGMGAMRVRADLAAYGIAEDAREAALVDHDAAAAALLFARRRRLGPFGPPIADPKQRNRQMAAMARAGHGHELARRIIDAGDAAELGDLTGDDYSDDDS